ncbi:alternative ribosome rescue aminoacyl-tRNA hydrolase ArfB [Patiriisocius sp. Uisw_017]|jgi:ribosome-associated protein|uniref:alternative ribosome rescue aminoacyl-tRNA hydrolase ArfB n=1 Tax=Patiriisocius sp. Uisw_017 TaxID=3230968 RepID=UPI0039EA4046
MNTEIVIKELTFKAVRSSGPGGQHVNKTSSKVNVSFDIENSKGLTETEKNKVREKLSNRVSSAAVLSISCSDSRSQHRNKALVVEKLLRLLKKSLRVVKPRKKTKPSRSAIERRVTSKKKNALKKSNRRPPSVE